MAVLKSSNTTSVPTAAQAAANWSTAAKSTPTTGLLTPTVAKQVASGNLGSSNIGGITTGTVASAPKTTTISGGGGGGGGTPTPTVVQPNVATGTPGTQGYQGYLSNIATASQPNALQTGATQASALYGMLGQQAQLQPFAGGQTQDLLQSYANLTRPQSTQNLAGETGLFNVQQGILQNAANTTAQQALAQQQLQTQGAETVGQLAQPQAYGITSTPYSPATNTFGTMPGGTSGAGNAGITLGNIALAQSIPTFQTAINQIDTPKTGIKDTIKSYLSDNPQINPFDLTVGNKFAQWVQSGQLGDPKYQTLADYLTEFATTLAPILGANGSVTNYKNQLSQNMINGLASGQNIAEVLDNESKLAQGKLDALKATVAGGGATGTGNTLSNFNW